MKLSYDQATDSLYIHLADRPSVNSDEVADDGVLDFDSDGALGACPRIGIVARESHFESDFSII